jgi:hypothetical protein
MTTAGSIKVFLSMSVAALAFASAQTAMAQSDDPTTSRADVKAQTRAANKSNDLWRGGEASLPTQPFMSEKSRSQRKGDTIGARRAGELKPSGEADYKANVARPARTDKTRAERKSETLAAAKSGNLAPSGEGGDGAPKIPMK